MERVTLRLTDELDKKLNTLVEDYNEFPSKSEAIRTAVYDLIDKRVKALLTRAELVELCSKRDKYR